MKLNNLFKVIGPGFIIASVCLGPGSITTSSKIGAEYGYQMLWVIVMAVIGMAMYTSMSARFGVSHDQSILQVIAATYGRWFAVLIGISAFLAASSFQFGNNLGAATALNAITGIHESVWPVVITSLAILLIFFARNLYKLLEKLMLALVVVMIIAFFANLIFARPDLSAAAVGLIPLSMPAHGINVMAALVGTTFVLHACLYQSYLVQDKGWQAQDLQKGMRDSVTGIAILGIVSM